MLEDVKYTANNNVSIGDTRIKSSDFAGKKISFKGNPNAVDTTPTADTYAPNGDPLPPEISFGEKFTKYIVPTWLGLHFGTELFNKANSGEYEKSLVGRLGKWGDEISGTRLIRNDFVAGMKNKTSQLKNSAKRLIVRTPILKSMVQKPTAPECPLVTNFLETQAEADIKEGAQTIEKYLKNNPKTLSQAGATEAEIQALKAKYGTGLFGRVQNSSQAVEEFLLNKIGTDLGRTDVIPKIERTEAFLDTQIAQLENLSKDKSLPKDVRKGYKAQLKRYSEMRANYRANTLKNFKMRAMGVTQQTISAAGKDPHRYGSVIESALTNANKYNPTVSHGLNKIKSISTPTTKLGRFLPNAAKLGMRGLTFGGGLFNSLFVAFFLADAVKNTIDAPKDKKSGTLAQGLLDAISWVIAMPLSIKAMHHVNGAKDLGKTKTQVDAYKSALKTFNENVKAGRLQDKTLYDQAYNQLMALKNAGTKPTGFGKFVSKVASFLSIGLEQPERYREATQGLGAWGSNIKNWIKPENLAKIGRNLKRNLPNIGKNVVGYPLRFALYAFAFEPIINKIFSLGTQAIFGKPYEPEKLKEEAEKAKQQEEMEAMRKYYLYPGPALSPNPEAVKGLDNLDINKLTDDNIIKKELIKRGLAQPNGTNATTTQNENNGYTNSVNGISVNIKNDADPFMPPANNGGNGCGVNGQPNINEKDPNKSDYDTVPRTYVPQINKQNPVPYGDPYATPGYERNYENLSKNLEKSNKFIEETEKMMENKFRD